MYRFIEKHIFDSVCKNQIRTYFYADTLYNFNDFYALAIRVKFYIMYKYNEYLLLWFGWVHVFNSI